MLFSLFAAFAQQAPPLPENGINVQAYRVPMDAERTLWADDAGRVLDRGALKGRVFLHYVKNPFEFFPRDESEPTIIVGDVLQADALLMYQYSRFRLGVDVPVYLLTTGELTNNAGGLGDLAIDGRVTLSDRTKAGVGTALGGRLTLPTSTVETPLGWQKVSGEVFGIIDGEIDRVLVTANLGGRIVNGEKLTNVDLDDQLFARLGAGWQLVDDAGLSLDFNGNLNLGEFGNIAGIPIEGMLGGWGRANSFVFRGGVGTGLTRGITSPDFRAVFGIGFEPKAKDDPDGDGLIGKDDQCPKIPEDIDQFEDLDGCPDPDNDKDNILDIDDQCVNDPEDVDGYKDDDGCPDFTTQVMVKAQQQDGSAVPGVKTMVMGDGVQEQGPGSFVLDLHEGDYTAKATAPEFVSAEKAFAAPLPEGQEEIILILQPDVISGELILKVSNEKGESLPDVIWYMDGGVGPAPINNGSATVTVPAGTHTLDVRHEGYVTDRQTIKVPEKGSKVVNIVLQTSQVEVVGDRIDIRDSVYFETAKAKIQARSFGLLDGVASALADHPEILKVRIEGHTDSRGNAAYNKRLSDSRAQSVRDYLIGKGVDPGRLEAVGYGEERPIDPREVAEAWEKNRRVDFFITERSD